MIYEFAHFLRDRLPWIWDCVDVVNSALFSLRYGRRLKRQNVSNCFSDWFHAVPIQDISASQLVDFFARQPETAFRFFKPHGFDESSINKLRRNKAFLAYALLDTQHERRVVGYCFIRAFFFGKGFRGRMVDADLCGRGLGTMMNKFLNDVGFGIGLRLFETVNKENVASYRSALAASNVRVIEEMADGDVYLEVLKD